MALMHVEAAVALAAILNDEDDQGWRYEVIAYSNGRARVQVYDDEDNLVGVL